METMDCEWISRAGDLVLRAASVRYPVVAARSVAWTRDQREPMTWRYAMRSAVREYGGRTYPHHEPPEWAKRPRSWLPPISTRCIPARKSIP